MIQERVWITFAILMVLPIILGIALPEPYGSIAIMGSSLAVVFYIRRITQNMAKGLIGGKLKYQCLICQGTKFDSRGICNRCGRASKKPI